MIDALNPETDEMAPHFSAPGLRGMPVRQRMRSADVERRQHPRFPCMLDTSYRRVAQNGYFKPEAYYMRCKTVNISESGLLLEGDAFVSEGQVLEVYVKLEGGFKIIAGEAVAVRSAKQYGKFRIGIRFIKKEVI